MGISLQPPEDMMGGRVVLGGKRRGNRSSEAAVLGGGSSVSDTAGRGRGKGRGIEWMEMRPPMHACIPGARRFNPAHRELESQVLGGGLG